MTGFEKYEYWLTLSRYDIETAKVLLDAERYSYVPVVCQQAVERLLKGMFVCHTGKEASKSHNIPFLANKLAENPTFAQTPAGIRFKKEKDDYEEFMVDLMFYYMSDYPFSYKKFHERFIEKSVAENLYNNTVKLLTWLESFQPTPVKKVTRIII
ncbi:MAG TPA: HEPN domain-containing protein [Bacillota bacterium]|nr:HEPN domain-containing protein [Bacillota bacterium]HOK68308.1 HEPN domain-containing protein [Bacillota bacterium]HPP84522.1 HEPN domain-containing protein [Bacillota bacterium]